MGNGDAGWTSVWGGFDGVLGHSLAVACHLPFLLSKHYRSRDGNRSTPMACQASFPGQWQRVLRRPLVLLGSGTVVFLLLQPPYLRITNAFSSRESADHTRVLRTPIIKQPNICPWPLSPSFQSGLLKDLPAHLVHPPFSPPPSPISLLFSPLQPDRPSQGHRGTLYGQFQWPHFCLPGASELYLLHLFIEGSFLLAIIL